MFDIQCLTKVHQGRGDMRSRIEVEGSLGEVVEVLKGRMGSRIVALSMVLNWGDSKERKDVVVEVEVDGKVGLCRMWDGIYCGVVSP